MRLDGNLACPHYRKMRLALVFALLLQAVALSAQTLQHDDVLAEIHKRLTSSEKLNYHQPLVFTGEIAELGPIFQGVCKSAVNQEVVFTVSRVLFGSYRESQVRAGYINCTWQPLPSPPFTLHTKVIVYCEQQFKALHCLAPVQFTDDDLKKVESWTADLQAARTKDLKRTATGTRELGEATGSALLVIHERLQDSERLAENQGFVFVGEVSRNDEVRQKRCAVWGVEHKVAYRVSEILWNYAGSLTKKGDEARKGFIDCRQVPLPPPFVTGVKVIVYCEAPGAGMGDVCYSPVLLTDDRLRKVQSWIEELRQREGDPVLLQIHQRLRDSLQRGPTHPLLLLGQITWIEPRPRAFTIMPLLTMRMSVSRVLWGRYKEPEITSGCPGNDCSNLAVGAKMIVFCEYPWAVYAPQAPGCGGLVSSAFTVENVRRVEGWAAQARQREPSLILERIKKSLASSHSGENWEPKVYRGYVESIGKADNGVPLEHFVDTTGHGKTRVNLEFPFPYPRVPEIEIGKPMITFCYQRDDVCYAGEEAFGIIEDLDETFREVQKLIGSDRQ